MTDFANLLNKEQLEAATAPDGPLLILAAAGTGKTRTLIYRVVHLLERGVNPQSILLLTFTNRAAKEMLERAEKLTVGMTSGLWGGTFHHVASRILRRFSSSYGFPIDFQIIDADDQKKLMKQIVKDCGFDGKNFPKPEVALSLVSGAVNRGLELERFAEKRVGEFDLKMEDLARVAAAYRARKEELKVMDFDDLLVRALNLLRNNEHVRAFYQNKFTHILVDEYQDTNSLQSEFVDILAEGRRNISVVGDDFQCIYSWRGSNFKNIMDFPARYEGARVVKLEQNYRSRPEILAVANESIRNNPGQFQKTLRATIAPGGALPTVHQVWSDKDQGAKAIQLIRRALDAGYGPADIAVLYRSHFHSIDTQMSLPRAAIPYETTSGIGYFEQAHVKDVLALLRIVEFPSDWLSFERVICLLTGAGPTMAEKLWRKLGDAFAARDPSRRALLLDAMAPKIAAQWKPIHAALGKYASGASTATEFVADFLKDFYKSHLKKEYDNPDEREEDIMGLCAELARNASLKDFLSEVALLTNIDRAGATSHDGAPRVLLSTIHQSKGLEWPVVIVLSAVEGLFPSPKSIEEGDDSEERRLFYVAVTRAKEQLHFITPKMRSTYDGGMYECEQTRFIREIPKNCIKQETAKFAGFNGYNQGYTPRGRW